MINTVFARDNEDEELGAFFDECFEDLSTYFESTKIEVKELKSPNLNEVEIYEALGELAKFIIMVYSHGSENEFLAGGIVPFINNDNANVFSNSFFYTCSCSTGKILGNKLIEEGCLSYIGYKKEYGIWDFNRKPFVECANFGIKLFFKGIASYDVLAGMQEKYNEHIDNYNNDVFGAAILLSNRKCLTHLGNNITINDLVA